MKNLKSRLAMAGLAILASTAIVAGAVSAFGGGHVTRSLGEGWQNPDPEMQAQMEQKRAQMQEHQAEMQAIFENEDYDGWAEKMQERDMPSEEDSNAQQAT